MNHTTPFKRQVQNKLLIKGIWSGCNENELHELFGKYGNIHKIYINDNYSAVVHYQSPKEASSAMTALNETKPFIHCNETIKIEYFENKKFKNNYKNNIKKIPAGIKVRENTNNILIRGLPSTCDEHELYQLCSKYGFITCVRLCRNGYGYVRFLNCDEASKAIIGLNDQVLQIKNQSCKLRVKLANSDPFQPRIQVNLQNQQFNPSLYQQSQQYLLPNTNYNDTNVTKTNIQYLNPTQQLEQIKYQQNFLNIDNNINNSYGQQGYTNAFLNTAIPVQQLQLHSQQQHQQQQLQPMFQSSSSFQQKLPQLELSQLPQLINMSSITSTSSATTTETIETIKQESTTPLITPLPIYSNNFIYPLSSCIIPSNNNNNNNNNLLNSPLLNNNISNTTPINMFNFNSSQQYQLMAPTILPTMSTIPTIQTPSNPVLYSTTNNTSYIPTFASFNGNTYFITSSQ